MARLVIALLEISALFAGLPEQLIPIENCRKPGKSRAVPPPRAPPRTHLRAPRMLCLAVAAQSYSDGDEEPQRETHTSVVPESCRDVVLPQGAPRPRSHAEYVSQEAAGFKTQLRNRNNCLELDFSSVLYGASFSLSAGVRGACCPQGTQILPGMGQRCLCMLQACPALQGSCGMSKSWSWRWHSSSDGS